MENNILDDCRSLVCGYKQVERGIRKDEILLIISATDVDAKMLSNIKRLADQYNIDIISLASKALLGEWLNLDVDCSFVGIVSEIDKELILKKLNNKGV